MRFVTFSGLYWAELGKLQGHFHDKSDLVEPQIDIRLFKEIRSGARKSIFLFKGTDRNSDRCFDIFLKINGSLPDQVSLQLHTSTIFWMVEI